MRRTWLLAVVALAAAGTARAAEEQVAVVDTPLGRIVWRFLPGAAPNTVAYVRHLIETGFYDGTTFHRVIPHFVIQGGDPNSRNDDRSDDGDGEADRRVPAEFSKTLHYHPGTVGMARDTDPDSGSCQFFIALVNVPRLDGRYTIFGEVIEGLDVALRIAAVPRDDNDNPLVKVPVKIRLERRRVPSHIRSADKPGPDQEVLTGPDKPRFFDPRDTQWQAPVPVNPSDLASSPPAHAPKGDPDERRPVDRLPPVRFDLAVDRAGNVIDVRFPNLPAPGAERILKGAFRWKFEPARYAGEPQKVRFTIDSDGRRIGPSAGAGADLKH